MASMRRRDVLKLAGAAFLPAAGIGLSSAGVPSPARTAQGRTKKIIVAGGGIGGLCCAYELMERGHEVTVLEASGRTGGHVRTIRDPLADGLYVDGGAEHFTKPGYDLCWNYFTKFELTALP